MPIEVESFGDVEAQLEALDLRLPRELAFLPRNLLETTDQDELLHESSLATLRMLFRKNGIKEDRIEPRGQSIPEIKENAFELILPTLFVSGLLLTSNPGAVNVALSVIASYATDFFKGVGGENRVRFSIVIKDKKLGRYQRYKYNGDPDGLSDFKEIVEKIKSE